MSYFIGAFRNNAEVINTFEKILAEIVPSRIRNDTFRMERGSSYFSSYGANKVIRNIAIRNDNKGSWLVLIGTPLVKLNSEQQEQEFLDEFLTNP